VNVLINIYKYLEKKRPLSVLLPMYGFSSMVVVYDELGGLRGGVGV
jgi:hypothetical protein